MSVPLDIDSLSPDELTRLKSTLTPRLNRYIPIDPTPKQRAFLLLNDVREILYGGAAGGGKDLDITTPILTVSGWKTMETVEIGDKVFGRDGIPAEVTWKSEVFTDHVCYKLLFDNDEEIIAGETHKWVIDQYQNRLTDRVMTTKQIYDTMGTRTNHAITKSVSLKHDTVPLQCHPYAFGVWLGDGAKHSGALACQDTEIHEELNRLGYSIYTSQEGSNEWKSKRLRDELRLLGFISRNDPTDKRIPREYLMASVAQRLQLLWGLMDTDGNASSDRGYCSICMVSYDLMKDIEELVRSLGIKVTLRESMATCTNGSDPLKKIPKYNLKWSTPLQMFTLPYKKALQNIGPFRGTQVLHYIKEVTLVPTVKTQCIQVDNDDHIFLVGNALIPTHNSVAQLAAALQYVDVPKYNAILFRRTYADLSLPGALIPMSHEWLASYKDRGEVHWSDKQKMWTFPSNATLSFGYLENKGDHYRYQGAEYQYVGVDEVTQIIPKSYEYMFSRIRRLKGASVPIRVRSTANPGGEYGDYYYQRFFVEGPEKKRIFIAAGLKDNPHLDEEEYRQALAELDPVTRAQLEEGNWQIKESGDVFERSWLIQCRYLDIPTFARRVRYWDCAGSEKKDVRKSKEPDFSVGFKMAYDKGIFYIEDIIRVQMKPNDLKELIKSTAALDGKACAIRMEQEPGSSGIIAIDFYKKELFGYDFAGVRSTGSKLERARIPATVMQGGSMLISDRCRNALAFYGELDTFPEGLHDDTIDGLSGSVEYFTPKTAVVHLPSRVGPVESTWNNMYINRM